ncbi:MAG TPA: prepilin-type N-terminal cleavage/methylation domain-containing protein [Terriglobales bacterium]|jgi:prepilin-type N-terminal cleavage/methylation domain-containing protein|nr:prepilin-type N-terminal cleavage/methylation domain-containing protein [Terriglobales bacterium]
MSRHSQGQRGFSLMEMLIVVAVLSLVMGAIFSTILDGMKKYRLEENRVNTTQESREFLDQIVRDLHSAGYPGLKMFTPSALTAPAINNSNVASGLVAVSATDIWFEGDIDDSGSVQSIRYTLQTEANGDCPCTMMRSAVPKAIGAPAAQVVNYNTQLENVINSTGGATPYTIDGTTIFNGTSVNNDTLYASYKTIAVFTFYDQNGNAIAVPNDLQGGNLATGVNVAQGGTVRMISVALNLLSSQQDLQTHLRSGVSMRAMVKLNNLQN